MVAKEVYERIENVLGELELIAQSLVDSFSLGSTVPPDSESASPLRDQPPLTSRADSEIPERGNGPREQWNMLGELARVKGELDAVNQHVKILETDLAAADNFKEYVRQYFPHAFKTTVSNLKAWGTDQGWDDKDDAIAARIRKTLRLPAQPAGGPPTPDLAAQPDSNSEKQPPFYITQRIGVYDYNSLVNCLRTNFKTAFPDYESPLDPVPDPQDIIQLMTAEIQHLRRQIEARRDNA